MRDPNQIKLTNITKLFEYEAMSREIDGCGDIEELRLVAKCYLKVYLATLEAMTDLKIST